MFFRRSHTVAAVLAGLALTLSACSGSDSEALNEQGYPETLTLAAIPAENSTDLKASYEPVIALLERETGSEIDFVQASDYAGVVEGLIAGNVDLAFFGPFAYVVAGVNGAEMTPLGAVVQDKGTPPGYQSYGLTRADNDQVEELGDFKGKKVCFVDPSSTSGYLFPTYNLIKAGIDPQKDITPVFAGKHDASALKVSQGAECDAGFAEDSAVEAQSGLKVVAKTMVPGAPMVFSTTLPDDLKKTLSDKLSKVTIDDIQKAGIKNADSDGFKATFYAFSPVDDKYYDQIRDICTVTKATQCQPK